jgi:thymidine kinase
MNAGKSTRLLQEAHNYESRNQFVVYMTSDKDTRYGVGVIGSRILSPKTADIIFNDYTDIKAEFDSKFFCVKVDAIFIDEAQFLTTEQVEDLTDMVDRYNIPVICYGLRTDFKGQFFSGSEALMRLADKIEEIKAVCWCGRKATMNARLSNGKVVKDGQQVQIGAEETYIALCRKHFKEGKLK